jgi:hypothetical protein
VGQGGQVGRVGRGALVGQVGRGSGRNGASFCISAFMDSVGPDEIAVVAVVVPEAREVTRFFGKGERFLMAQTAADVLVNRLVDWGVRVIFGLPGDGINGITVTARTRCSGACRPLMPSGQTMASCIRMSASRRASASVHTRGNQPHPPPSCRDRKRPTSDT